MNVLKNILTRFGVEDLFIFFPKIEVVLMQVILFCRMGKDVRFDVWTRPWYLAGLHYSRDRDQNCGGFIHILLERLANAVGTDGLFRLIYK